jgi:hypothetical protein
VAVQLKLRNVLTTENVVKGQAIEFDVAEDVVVAGHVVILKGDPAQGTVIAVKGAGKKLAKDAAVIFKFDSVRSVDSQTVILRKNQDKPKKSDSKANEIEANEPLPGYAERVIGAEKGTVYTAYVDAPVVVRVSDTPVVPPIAAVAPVQPTQANPTGEAQPTSGGGQMPTTAAAPGSTVSTPPAPEEPATVDFNSNPPGADILIDGVLVGNTPSTQHVNAGRHVIQLRIGGYSSWTRTMMIEPGSYPSIRATLEKQ